ncbi:hypothetical protein DFA_09657 [Cavenderia fasciculata]|uniref:EGF-like domain-containing protein n=1 Tax=Cavenderia fasciculata TaxID=261658 RepID=F4Q885_CACFS|nr:uncharacterized protein DFA_09657 [Cavenderia fasciculata]EGG15985.1 hypothetical protein DFA_09657 [Cavenderia fasciculata]|eukprot:XP_004352310.1 hypothetical protein DFA_09657 [Cavenderia fasciculata]
MIFSRCGLFTIVSLVVSIVVLSLSFSTPLINAALNNQEYTQAEYLVGLFNLQNQFPVSGGVINFCGNDTIIKCDPSKVSVISLLLVGNGSQVVTLQLFTPFQKLTVLNLNNVQAGNQFVPDVSNYKIATPTWTVTSFICKRCNITALPDLILGFLSFGAPDNPIEGNTPNQVFTNLRSLDLSISDPIFLRERYIIFNQTSEVISFPDTSQLVLSEIPGHIRTGSNLKLYITLGISFNFSTLSRLGDIKGIDSLSLTDQFKLYSDEVDFPLSFLNIVNGAKDVSFTNINFRGPSSPLLINSTSLRSLIFRNSPLFNINGGDFPFDIFALTVSIYSLVLSNCSIERVPDLIIKTVADYELNLDLSNNQITTIPNNPKNMNVNFNNNQLTGTIPTSYCNTYSFFANNSLGGVLPDCYRCFAKDPFVQRAIAGNNGFTNFDTNWTPSQYPSCSPTTLNVSMYFFSVGSAISVTGMIGWTPDYYHLPQYPTVFRNIAVPNRLAWINGIPTANYTKMISDGYFNVTFTATTPNVTVRINVTVSKAIIDSVEYVPIIGGYSFFITGSGFGANVQKVSFKLGPYTCVTSSAGNIFAACLVYETSIPQDMYNMTVLVQGVPDNADPFPVYIKYPYPFVFAVDGCPITGGPVILYGSYGTVYSNASVLVDQLECAITSINETIINCTISETGTRGYHNLTVVVNSILWFSYRSFVYTEDNLPCPNNCGGHGRCDGLFGACMCDKGWTGPSCSFALLNQTGSGGGIDHNTTIGTDLENGQFNFTSDINFGFKIVSIRELDGLNNENVSREIQLSGWKPYNMTNTNVPNPYQNNTYTNRLMLFDNETTIIYQMELVKEDRNHTFADYPMVLKNGSIKISFSIAGWPYLSQFNSLQLVIESSVDPIEAACALSPTIQTSSTGDSLNYLTLELNGKMMYGRFVPRVISDGRPTYSKAVLVDQQTNSVRIGLNLPYCQTLCELDPDFSSLLIESKAPVDECHPSDLDDKKWILPTAIVVGVVGFVMLSIIGIFVARRVFYVKVSLKHGVIFLKKRRSRD